MNRDNPLHTPEMFAELDELIVLAGDRALTAVQVARIEEIVVGSEAASLHYAAMMHVHAGLLRRFRVPGDSMFAEPIESLLMRSPQTKAASPSRMPVLNFAPLGSAWRAAGNYLSDHEFFTGNLVATLFFAVAALIGSNVYVSTPDASQYFARQYDDSPSFAREYPQEKEVKKEEQVFVWVGRITGKVDCVWAAPGRTFGSSTDFLVALHDKYSLTSGLMEITYNTGAKVILQGPCTYEVDSADSGYLSLGKLTARVEKKGTGKAVASGQWSVASESTESRNPEIPKSRNSSSLATSHQPLATNSNPQSPIPNPSSPAPRPPSPAPLFSVRTPTAIVTDLGTEFGVEIDRKGNTTSHVYQGRVVVVGLISDGRPQNGGIELRENESARVKKVGSVKSGEQVIIVEYTTAEPVNFARRLPRYPYLRAIDLADIVAGGKGIHRSRSSGINPDSGTPVSLCHTETLYGRGEYSPLNYNPLIDGVFIPNGAAGPVQIDSAKNTFDGFPKTTGTAYGPIWSGPGIQVGWWEGKNMEVATIIKGIDYGGAKHSMLGMIPNKGITFDLAAIRDVVPDRSIIRFRAVAGNNEIVSSDPKMERVSADVWVFVDGQVRFSKTDFNARDGAFDIDVPLDDKNRYLTLATTDAGNKIHSDWVVFGDPFLDLEVREEEPETGEKGAGDKKPWVEDL